jgi:hypothetical protein
MERRTPMEYDEFDEQANGPKALRDALDKANKEKAALAKQVQEALDKVAQFEKQHKAQSLSDLLKAKGVDPKYAKWADKDDVEPSESAIDAWLEDNKELIPVASVEDSQPNPPANENANSGDQGDPFAGLPDEVRTALSAMQSSQQLESNASSVAPFDPRAEDAVEKSLGAIAANAQSEADLLKALSALGAPIQSGY